MTKKLLFSWVVIDVAFARGISRRTHIGHGAVFELRRKVFVDLGPLRRQIRIVDDGFNGALGDARAAVDAKFGVNHGKDFALVFCRVDTIDRADLHTGGVAFAETFVGNNESHEAISIVPSRVWRLTKAIFSSAVVGVNTRNGSTKLLIINKKRAVSCPLCGGPLTTQNMGNFGVRCKEKQELGGEAAG